MYGREVIHIKSDNKPFKEVQEFLFKYDFYWMDFTGYKKQQYIDENAHNMIVVHDTKRMMYNSSNTDVPTFHYINEKKQICYFLERFFTDVYIDENEPIPLVGHMNTLVYDIRMKWNDKMSNAQKHVFDFAIKNEYYLWGDKDVFNSFYKQHKQLIRV